MASQHLRAAASRKGVVSVRGSRGAGESQDREAPLDLTARGHWRFRQSRPNGTARGRGRRRQLKGEWEAPLWEISIKELGCED